MAKCSSNLLSLFLVPFLPLVFCKRYDLAVGWNISVTNKARTFEAAEQAGSYRILHAMTEDELILSDTGKFGLSFFSFNGSNSYYLSIIIGTSFFTNTSASGTVVWTANRNMPVSGNGSLHISQNGTLSLLDSDGKILWSPTQSAAAVSSIQLQESGNLVLYNSSGGIIWQSFDEPGDVLLEGQSLRTGQKLVGTSNSSTMAEGDFEGVVDKSGFGFFLRSSGEPYYLSPLWNHGSTPADVNSIGMECPSYITVLTYNSSHNASVLSMAYHEKSPARSATSNARACSPETSLTSGATGQLNHLKLHPNGSLVQRFYNSSTSAWTTNAEIQQTLLGSCLPFSCPANAICMQNGQCECMKAAAGNRTCSSLSDLPVTCNELEAENHHFWPVPGASYFSNKFLKADKISTLEDCKAICLSNCSCQALFYNNVSSSCFFVKEVHGSLTADATSTAFLKLQNPKLVLPKKSSRLRNVLAIFGGVSSLLVAVIFMIGFWLWKRQQRRLKQIQDALAAALRGAPQRYTYKELKQATRNFSSLLGAGGSGSVYQGTLNDGSRVAIKKLENSSQGEKEFITEVNTIGSISHVNIVKLCGYCVKGCQRMLVYEHVANGSLDNWLFSRVDDSSGALLDWKTRYGIALGAARGLAYLHGESRLLIMHLDVKPQNILLDENFVAKVSDFGMSKLIVDREASEVITNVRGTPGYLAPEWLLNSVATKKCDVYSYGMVLLELIGGKRNIRETTSEFDSDEELGWYFPAWVVDRVREGRILAVVDQDLVDTLDEQMKLEALILVRVALWCIQANPADRPSMDAVVQMIEGHKEVAVPPLSFHFAIQCPGIINLSSRGNSKISVFSLSSIEQASGGSTVVPDLS